MKELIKMVRKPALYEKGEENFWNDEHISKGMLKAHLSQDTNSASYKKDRIMGIVNYLCDSLKISKGNTLLDCGCGPGLYCEMFSEKDLEVTGVDVSIRSLEYAKKSAKKKRLNITYINKNYLEVSFENEFDVVCIIWHDLCVLNRDEVYVFLNRVYNALKPNGYFVFDVSTPTYDQSKDHRNSWSVQDYGFWSSKPHLVLSNTYFYNGKEIRLNQDIVIEENRMRVFRRYHHHYTKGSITQLLSKFGFTITHYLNDLNGKPYTDGNDNMAIIAQKIL